MVWVLLPLVAAAIVFCTNRYVGPSKADLEWNGEAGVNTATTLKVATWNIGFAGQGAKAEMFFDGGRYVRPLDRQEIEVCADDIAQTINSIGADVTLIQEDAHSGFLNRGVNLYDRIRRKNSGQAHLFWADMQTRFSVPNMGLKHGLTTLTHLATSAKGQVLDIPQDPIYFYGAIKKYYGGIVTRFSSTSPGRDWVVINIHLSAFDDGAVIRRAQVDAVLARAQLEFKNGHAVVIGGDWNMSLVAAEFPHDPTTPVPSSAFKLTEEMLPNGWCIIADDEVPSNRSVHAPYQPGVTRTDVLDGFVVSPNVRVPSVEALDLGFRSSDHQPVVGHFEMI